MTTWTEERVERLKQLWAGDRSVSWIAIELGGITRNAVIGKVHRLGLPRRGNVRPPNPSSKKRSPSRPVARKPVSVPKVAPAPPEPAPEPANEPHRAAVGMGEPAWITELRPGECKFPVYHGRKHLFCAGEAVLGKPYCTAHMKAAYQPAPKHSPKETEEQKKARLQRAQISRRKSGQTVFAGAV